MPKSRKRGGTKSHRKKVQKRKNDMKVKQETFMKQFRDKLDKGVKEELEKEANALKESNQPDGTEVKNVLNTPMGTTPTK
jgi:hypothetical protein